MPSSHDAILVGARCAGSSAAMLLARAGHRVLLLDRASFPSDTMSTHLVHQPGIAALERWGLLDQLVASGCPPIGSYRIDFGPVAFAASPRPAGTVATAYAPRPHGARQAAGRRRRGGRRGAARGPHGRGGPGPGRRGDRRPRALRRRRRGHGARRGGGRRGRAALDRGQGGPGAVLPRAAVPRGELLHLLERPGDQRVRGLHPAGAVLGGLPHPRRPDGADRRLAAARVRGQPRRRRGQLPAHVRDGAGVRRAGPRRHPGQPLRRHRRPAQLLPGAVRTGLGAVGDAGCHKDPITAQGISDPFRDAELLAGALHRVLGGEQPYEQALAGYQRARDGASLPMFELTCQLASMAPPPPELQALLGALPGNPEAAAGFVSVIAGTLPAPEFFAPDNVQRIMAAAAPVEG